MSAYPDTKDATGADLLVSTLLENGVDTCFANPGTSEMHFVAALDDQPKMHCILGLFEGVVTGAADGYGRMTGRPAATLLHTGPGLANGLANLHNARRANTPLLNIVGDHASTHLPYDAPLTSDIEGLARPMSHWVGRVQSAATIAEDAATALGAACTGAGRVATLILPADAAWGAPMTSPIARMQTITPDDAVTPDIAAAARLLRSGKRCLLLLGGRALRQESLEEAGRIAAATGACVMSEQTNARCEGGLGRLAPLNIPYLVDSAVAALAEFEAVILIGARAPVAFFQFPNKPNIVTAPNAQVMPLADCDADLGCVLGSLRGALGLSVTAPVYAPMPAPLGSLNGALDFQTLPAAIVRAMPENAIVCDEAISYSKGLCDALYHAPPHDLLQLTGGSIGIGPALSVGAAVACPDRPVLNVQADGSAFYTLQSLWTQAHAGLDVVTVILSNRKYASLYGELERMGRSAPGPNGRAMLDIGDPAVDWAALARGMGVEGRVADTGEELTAAIAQAFSAGGPHLIEARMKPSG